MKLTFKKKAAIFGDLNVLILISMLVLSKPIKRGSNYRDFARVLRSYWMTPSGSQRWSQYCTYWWPSAVMCSGIYSRSDHQIWVPYIYGTGTWGIKYHECQRSIAWLVANSLLNTSRPEQNGHQFADDIFKFIFLDENCCTLIKILLQIVPVDLVNDIEALVQVMAWRRPGDKPLHEPILTQFTDAHMRR